MPSLLEEEAAMMGTSSASSSIPTPDPSPFPSYSSPSHSTPATTAATSTSTYVFNGSFNGTIPVIQGSGGWWNEMAHGAHVGVVIAIIFGVCLIVLFSFWFCCGGRAWWSKHHDPPRADARGLPLYTLRGRNTRAAVHRPDDGRGDAPPMYAEVAPPEHQTVAGGIQGENEVQRIEEESAVVSDGKTPLSEIPFEDVVLERHPSENESSGSSSRGFQQRHHGMGGDTTGHTNT